MLLPTEPFNVEVINPAREEKDGGIKKGYVTTVRAVLSEQHATGEFLVYFLVWNPSMDRYMLEPAAQFAPVDVSRGASLTIPRKKK